MVWPVRVRFVLCSERPGGTLLPAESGPDYRIHMQGGPRLNFLPGPFKMMRRCGAARVT